MRYWSWNEFEDELLAGLPLIAQVLYLRGLRMWMDRATGLVGVRRGISWQMLMEVLYVEPHSGLSDTGTPDKKKVRRALEWLVKAGLVERRGNVDAIVFYLPQARRDENGQKQPTPNPVLSHPNQPAPVDKCGKSLIDSSENAVLDGATRHCPDSARFSQPDIPHKSIINTEVLTSSSSKISSSVAPVDNSLLLPGGKPVSRPVQIAVLVRKWEAEHSRIAALTGSHPKVLAWAEAGLTDDQLADAYSAAVADRDAKKDTRPISAGFLDVFIAKVLNPPVAVQGVGSGSAGGRQGPWHQSWQGICAKAAELGLQQGKDELAPHFKLRVYRAAGVTDQELRCATVDAGRR
jgi:hypothetical protein